MITKAIELYTLKGACIWMRRFTGAVVSTEHIVMEEMLDKYFQELDPDDDGERLFALRSDLEGGDDE